MRLARQVILSLLLLFSFDCLAQQPALDNYRPLTASGPIPEDFLKFYIRSQEYDQSRITGSEGERFRSGNASMLGRLFASGKILFNDPLSNYSQKVLDTLLAHEPELKGKLRVYTLRDAAANAFTSHDGKIFITTGFLANLENEAQLAYVLAHEAIHYRNNHLYLDFIYRSNMQPGSLGHFRYSREHEGEADIEGLRILMRSDYSPENIDWVLDVLFYSYLPVDNVQLDRKFFEAIGFAIPDSCYLQEEGMDDIGREDDNYQDVFQTHPSIATRKKDITDFLGNRANTKPGKQFLYPEDEFYRMRNIARFELSYLYYLDHKLEESIYNSYVLLSEFPGNEYLEKMMAGALYALCTYKRSPSAFKKVHAPHEKLEGYQRQFSYLFEKLSPAQLCTLALYFSGSALARHPQSKDLTMIRNEMEMLVKDAAAVSITPAPFSQEPPNALLVLADISVKDTLKGKKLISQPVEAYDRFREQAGEIGRENSMKIQVLDPYTLGKDDVDKYNDLVFLNDWFFNRLGDEQHHLFIDTRRVSEIVKKYNITALTQTNVSVHRNQLKKRLLPFGWLGVPLLFNKYNVTYYSLVLELTTSRLLYTAADHSNRVWKFPGKKKLERVLVRQY